MNYFTRNLNYNLRALSLAVVGMGSLPVQAQWGPGGVGNTNGTVINSVRRQPAMRTWFLADSGITESAGKVSAWADRSGRGITAVQATASLQPSLLSNAQNGRPVVRFNGTPNGCLTATFASTPSSTMTIMMVAKNVATSTNNGGMLSFSGFQGMLCNYTSPSYRFMLDGNGATGTNGAATPGLTTNPFRVLTGMYGTTFNTNNSFFSMDGSPYPVYSGSSVGIGAYSQLQLGGRTWGNQPSRIFSGDIAEAIVFDTQLDSAQRIIVETYLGAKYGVTIARNRYPFATTNRHELVGIGQAMNASRHDSAISNIITLARPQSLAANRYMFMAHDGASMALGTTETPGNDLINTRRIGREWRVAKSGGDLGTTRLYINYATINTSIPSGFTRGIFIDADGDFRTGAQFIDLLPSQANVFVTPDINIPHGSYITVGAVKRVVGFELPTSQAFEDVTEYPVIRAGLNFAYVFSSSLDVVIDYTLAGVGAFPASGPCFGVNDCRWESGRSQLIIPAGQQFVDINLGAFDIDAGLRLHNDTIPQTNGETVRLSITNVANATAGTQVTHDFTIIDDDFFRKVGFVAGQTLQTWNELDAGTYKDTTFRIALPNGFLGGPSFVLVVGSGTAKAGKDYQILGAGLPSDSTIRLMIDTTESFVLLRVRLLGDNSFEDNETVLFTLTRPSSATFSSLAPITARINFIDNDPPPTVFFSPVSANGLEATATLEVKVKVSIESGKLITVPFTTVGGTATGGGVDYSVVSPNPIYFFAGDTVVYITVNVIQADLEEDDETIIITLGTPTNATLSSGSVYTYTIIDDDVYGSNGPGGVEKNDGTGTLEAWYAADRSVTVSGNNVTSWGNLSGRAGRNVTPVSASPQLVSNGVNGKPVVRFAGQGLVANLGSALPSDPLTIFAVARQTTVPFGANGLGTVVGTDRWAGITSFGTNYAADGFTTSPSFIYPSASTTSTTTMAGSTINNFNIMAVQYTTGTTQNSFMYRNSALESNFTGTGINLSFHTFVVLGVRSPTNTANFFRGDLAEVILISSLLNTPRRIIVENYLGAKYNIPISNNYFSGALLAYKNAVGGIGTSDGTGNNKHRVATSLGLTLRQRNNSLDAANEYIFFGQTAGAATTQILQINSKNMEVWTKEWYLQKTGAIDVGFTFSYDDAGLIHLPLPINEYKLAYKSTPAGAWQYINTDAQSISGNQITFNVSNANLNSGYYTLARTDPAFLPVVFGKIAASRQSQGVRLRWTTLSEENAASFEVERSADGARYTYVGSVQAQGTSAAELAYTFADQDAPGVRLYYRLRQVDNDGRYLYSPTVVVAENKASAGFSTVSIYPNPTLGQITIALPEGDNLENLAISDMHGRSMPGVTWVQEGQSASANLASLPAGVYVVRLALGSGEVILRSLVRQ